MSDDWGLRDELRDWWRSEIRPKVVVGTHERLMKTSLALAVGAVVIQSLARRIDKFR